MITELKYHDRGLDTLSNKSHIHNEEFEILHVVNGDGTIMVKDKMYTLKTNTIFFIGSSDLHYSSPKFPEAYTRNKVIFSRKILCDLAKVLCLERLVDSLFMEGGTAVMLSAEKSNRVDNCFLMLSRLLNEDLHNEMFNMSFFIYIFTILDIVMDNKLNRIQSINNKFSYILSYINDNISNKITLDSICEEASVSKYYLCRNFKQIAGMTVFSYIETVRITIAKEMLSKTDYSISEIAQKVGFESFAYFSKVFKRQVNCTPRQYRKDNADLLT